MRCKICAIDSLYMYICIQLRKGATKKAQQEEAENSYMKEMEKVLSTTQRKKLATMRDDGTSKEASTKTASTGKSATKSSSRKKTSRKSSAK